MPPCTRGQQTARLFQTLEAEATFSHHFPLFTGSEMQRFVIFCHPLIQVCPFFFSYQHCRLNDKSQAPHISFVTHWVHVPATGAPLRAHLRLEQHPLASCINSMTHHASLWQAPPLLGCPRSLFNLRASKWSELTHYFPTKKKRESLQDRAGAERQSQIRSILIWPSLSGTAPTVVLLPRHIFIWVTQVYSDNETTCFLWMNLVLYYLGNLLEAL